MTNFASKDKTKIISNSNLGAKVFYPRFGLYYKGYYGIIHKLFQTAITLATEGRRTTLGYEHQTTQY